MPENTEYEIPDYGKVDLKKLSLIKLENENIIMTNDGKEEIVEYENITKSSEVYRALSLAWLDVQASRG